MKVRAFMEKEVKPLVNNYWLHDEFPFELILKFKELNICGVTYEGYGCPGMPFLMEGVIAMEMARIDASIATFFWCTIGAGNGFHIHMRFRGAKAEMASTNAKV